MSTQIDSNASVVSTQQALLRFGLETTDSVAFLKTSLGCIASALGADFAAVTRNAGGQWSAVASSGSAISLPATLLSDSLDREGTIVREGWLVLPVDPKTASGELLALRW